MSTREEIIIRTGFDNTTLAAGLRTTQGMVQDFATKVAGYLGGIFAGFQATAFARSIMEFADNIVLTSRRLGVTTKETQQLAYAAKVSGVELDTVAGALDRLAKAQQAVVQGDSGSEKIITALNHFGLSVENIKSLKPDQIFDAIAASMERTGVNSQVTADAMALMGRSAGELIPMLQTLRETQDEAPIVSDEDLQKIHRAGDELQTLWMRVKALSATAIVWAGDNLGRATLGANATGFKTVDPSWLTKLPTSSPETKAVADPAFSSAMRNAAYAALRLQDAGLHGQARLNALLRERGAIYAAIDYDKENQIALNQDQAELEKNSVALAEAKAEAERESVDLNHRLKDLYREQAAISREAKAHAAEGTWLTLEQLAGSRYTRSIEAQYAPGGRFDLSRGKNRFSREARELFRLTHGATAFDRLYGSQDQVDKDIARIGQLRQSLSRSGVLPPDEALASISKSNDRIADDISSLLGKASKDGIKVDIASN
jgi:hypothetical protein